MGHADDPFIWCGSDDRIGAVEELLHPRTDLPDLIIADWGDKQEDNWGISWQLTDAAADPGKVFADLLAALPEAEKYLSLDDRFTL